MLQDPFCAQNLALLYRDKPPDLDKFSEYSPQILTLWSTSFRKESHTVISKTVPQLVWLIFLAFPDLDRSGWPTKLLYPYA